MTGGRPSGPYGAPLDGSEIDALFAGWSAYRHIALAVSGGADSMALMRLADEWLKRAPSPPLITILSVDHRLRSEAADEAAWVKTESAGLGLPHETLAWEGPKPRSDLQAEARAARYGLMLEFCRGAGITALATAHTADDQAETLLMRLARGSGVDGLAAISPVSERGGIALLRPLLGIPRLRLEASLVARQQIWIEDPSNCDRRFERVRLREELRGAALFQLTPEKLALSARRLDRARAALDAVAADFLGTALTVHPTGYGEMPLAALRGAHEETAIRALGRLTGLFGGGKRPVRLARVESLYETLMRGDGRTATLGGCSFAARRGQLRIAREYGRIDPARLPLLEAGLLWDERFHVYAPRTEGLSVGPLGPKGLAELRAMKAALPVPAPVAHALPALWAGEMLVFAPSAIFAGSSPAFWRRDATALFTKAKGGPGNRPEMATRALTD